MSLKLDSEVIQSAIRDVINPWEISLALANPYYYDELYNLKAEWSKSSVNCLIDNIISNINSIKRILHLIKRLQFAWLLFILLTMKIITL